jgi:hypothetical protein
MARPEEANAACRVRYASRTRGEIGDFCASDGANPTLGIVPSDERENPPFSLELRDNLFERGERGEDEGEI